MTIRLTAGASIVLVLATPATAGTILVPTEYLTIQAAINNAINGDEIIVDPGTYAEVINFAGKAVTLRSTAGAAVTTIDGTGLGRVVTCTTGETAATVLQGFTITGGSASPGGGMRCSDTSPTILECVFVDNSTGNFGGALHVDQAGAPTITACTFQDNSAGTNGGAIFLSGDASAVITDTAFAGNSAGSGGGAVYMVTSGGPQFTGCTFESNSTLSGGAVRVKNGTPAFESCAFDGNVATTNFGGGAVYAEAGSLSFSDCTFSLNQALIGQGGAILSNATELVLTDSTFIGNDAHLGGAINASGLTATGCHFTGNESDLEAGGVEASAAFNPVSIVDCDFTDNASDGHGGGLLTRGSGWTVAGCTFQTNAAGTNAGGFEMNGSGNVRACRFIDNIAAGNGGGSSSSTGNQSIVNCRYFGNAAGDGGVHYATSSSAPAIVNCSMSGNSATSGGAVFRFQIAGTVYNSVIHGNPGGDGLSNWIVMERNILEQAHAGDNVVADPLFVNQAGGDLHLQAGSPAIDFGDDTYVPAGVVTDLDGNDRFVGAAVDAGAYEVGPACPEDLDGDTIVGINDFLQLLAAWGPCPGCPEDLDGDDNVGINDFLQLLAAWGPC